MYSHASLPMAQVPWCPAPWGKVRVAAEATHISHTTKVSNSYRPFRNSRIFSELRLSFAVGLRVPIEDRSEVPKSALSQAWQAPCCQHLQLSSHLPPWCTTQLPVLHCQQGPFQLFLHLDQFSWALPWTSQAAGDPEHRGCKILNCWKKATEARNEPYTCSTFQYH